MPLTATQQKAIELQAHLLELNAKRKDLVAARDIDIGGYQATYESARDAREAQAVSDVSSIDESIAAINTKLNSFVELEKE